MTDCLIIGGGPAGYTAAIYASRANLSPILYEGPQPGGQLTTTTEVENFPGYPDGITGPQLMDDIRRQALRFGADLRMGIVDTLDLQHGSPFTFSADGGKTTEQARTVIIATGAQARYLGVPGEDRLKGMGVSGCATCDGFFYRGRTVAVVGGGDTACEDALYLATLAQKVYVIVRKDHLRASKVMQQRLRTDPKVEILFNTNTVSLHGDEFLESGEFVEFRGDPERERKFTLALDGFFLAVGHSPNTAWLRGQVELDQAGYVVLHDGTTATNVPGVFAAGDVADARYRQAISAAGTGCRAAIDAERYLMQLPELQ